MMINKYSLKTQLLLMVCLSSVLLLFLHIYDLSMFYKISNERSKDIQQNAVRKTFEEIRDMENDINSSIELIVTNEFLQKNLNTEDQFDKIEVSKLLNEKISYFKRINKSIEKIVVLDKNKNYLYADFDSLYIMKDLFDKIKFDNYNVSTYYSVVSGNESKYIAIAFPFSDVFSYKKNSEVIGCFLAFINLNYLTEVLNNTPVADNGKLFLVDENDNVIADNSLITNVQLYSKNIIHNSNDNVKYYSENLNISKWIIVGITTINQIQKLNTGVLVSGFLTGISFLAFLVFITLKIIKSIMISVDNIVVFLKDSKNIISLKNRLIIKNNNEFSQISNGINHMLDEIQTMRYQMFQNQSRLYEMEVLKNKAELKFLQNQVNPHFLYNTINCIRNIAVLYDVNEIISISESISRIFRYSITNDLNATVLDEINNIKEYLNIVNIRYDGKIKTEIYADDEVLDIKVFRLLLQPIVENAVIHGLEEKYECGKVCIIIKKNGDKVKFSISDDGIGIKPERLLEIKETLKYNDENLYTDNCLALRNIQNRLKLQYGENVKLHIESTYEVGTTVNFEIPITE